MKKIIIKIALFVLLSVNLFASFTDGTNSSIDKRSPQFNIHYGVFAIEDYCKAKNSSLSDFAGLINASLIDDLIKTANDLDTFFKKSALNVLNGAYNTIDYYTSDTFLTVLLINSVIKATAHNLCSIDSFRQAVTQDYILGIIDNIIQTNNENIVKTSSNRVIKYQDKKYGHWYFIKIAGIKFVGKVKNTGKMKEKKYSATNPTVQNEYKEFLRKFDYENKKALQDVCEKKVVKSLEDFIVNSLNKLNTGYNLILEKENKCYLWKEKERKIGNASISDFRRNNIFNRFIGAILNTGYDYVDSFDNVITNANEIVNTSSITSPSGLQSIYDSYFSYLNDDYIQAFFKSSFDSPANKKKNFYSFYLKNINNNSFFIQKLEDYLLVIYGMPYYYTFKGINGYSLSNQLKNTVSFKMAKEIAKTKYQKILNFITYLNQRIRDLLNQYDIKNNKSKIKIKLVFNKYIKLVDTYSQATLTDDLFGCKDLTDELQQNMCFYISQIFYNYVNQVHMNNKKLFITLKAINYLDDKNFLISKKLKE